jgi:hypothetical protein
MEALMKKVFVILLTLLSAIPLSGQTIVNRDPSRAQIIQVKTALSHLTVIQLGEPVLSVAAGSDAFKIEWRGNKVFIEPTEAGVSTNLFIWTKSGRQNYELEPAGPVASMDFAIDGPVTKAVDPPPGAPAVKTTTPLDPMKGTEQWMLGGTPVRQDHWKAEKHHVQVMVRDLFRENGELYIRYSVENGTRKPYSPGTPEVFEVTTDASANVLLAHAYTQLHTTSVEELNVESETPLLVTGHDARAVSVLPGNEMVGVVGVKFRSSASAVVRLAFRDDEGRAVSAVVVI